MVDEQVTSEVFPEYNIIELKIHKTSFVCKRYKLE